MLGLVHRIALGLAPPQLASLLPVRGMVSEPAQRQRLRYWMPLHNKQVSTPANVRSSAVMKRLLCGIALCYNKFPQRMIDHNSVKVFQSALQQGLLRFADLRVAQGCDLGAALFNGLAKITANTLRRALRIVAGGFSVCILLLYNVPLILILRYTL